MINPMLSANAASMGLGLAFAILGLVLGSLALRWIDKYLFPTVDFVAEIKKGNIAAAIVVAASLLFVAVVLSTSLR